MEAINTWLGGMNQDMSKLLAKSDTYLYAMNMRPVSELGQSTGALEQIRGNQYEAIIPDVWNVYKLIVDITATTPDNSTITILGNTTSTFPVSSTTSGLNLYTQISSLPGFNVQFFASYDDTSVVIWATSYSSGADPNVTFTGLNLYYGTDGTSFNVYVPAQMGLFPIGSTFIRDKYYLFTCNNNLPNPGGNDPNLPTDPDQIGQIWEMTYDYTETNSTNTTLKLIYTNYINFTAAHPIPPTGTEGRYENDSIQRIYWTDNFNKLRSLNVVDPNLMSLLPSLISITPDINFGIPILQTVNSGGSLLSGIYQAAYRLTNLGGSKTNYSLPSNIVQIAGSGYSDTSALSVDNFRLYVGNNYNDTVGKSITWTINGIDTAYDNIEIIILRRTTYTDLPEVYQIITDLTPVDGEFTFTYDGGEDSIPITFEEYTASVSTFTQCKTIATKDNILFAGNIRNLQADLNYDARAYRFDTTGVAKLNDSQGISSYYTIGNINTVPENADAINPNQSTYKWQSDGVTIGGEGTNIKYTFCLIEIPFDSNPVWNNYPYNSAAGFKHSNASGPTNTTVTNVLNYDGTTQVYPLNNMNHGNKLPYETHLFRGYKRNEVYRFGIQFFDKQKSPYYAKWIADIKMPDYIDATTKIFKQDGTVSSGNFKIASAGYTYQLGIMFDVKIPSNISNQISGYSIVRAQRKKDDMTIAGQGVITMFEGMYTDSSVTTFTREIPGAVRNPYLFVPTSDAYYNNNAGTMLCPDWLLEPGLYSGYTAGDTIAPIGWLSTYILSSNGLYNNAFGLGSSGGNPYYQGKYYDHLTGVTSTTPVTVDNLQFFPYNGVINYSGLDHWNQSTETDTTMSGKKYRTPTDIESRGNDCHFVYCNSGIPFNPLPDAKYKLIVDYYKSNVKQYGGNSYSNRSQTEYILTGHFRSVTSSSVTTTDTFRVFGGDTWVNIYDSQKLIKNWQFDVATNKYSVSVYFPVETRTNIPLRQGTYINYNLIDDDGSGASGGETRQYNNVYSNENTILKFFPKPFNIIENDHWDNRIIYSNIKSNGENSDSWATFLPNNYWDVEGSYGPINALTRLRNEVYSIQDRGFARILINPLAITNTADNLPVVLGTGTTIQRHIYIGIEAGSMHQWSVTSSPNSILFVDAQKSRVYMFNGEQLKAITDSNNWTFLNKELIYGIIENDNPILNKGIITTFDQENSEYLITFLNTNSYPEYNKKNTLVYNEITNKFTSFYSFTPNLYINNNRTYYTVSARNTNKLYIHNRGNIGEFYGNTPNAQLKLIMNNQPSFTKVLDNFVWHTEVIDDPVYQSDVDNINMFPNTWTTIRIYNDYQNTDVVTLDPTVLKNIRRVERGWQLQVPRNKVLYSTSASPNIFTDLGNKPYGERMRDKTFTIELEFNNPNNYRFIMHYLKSIFRVSYK